MFPKVWWRPHWLVGMTLKSPCPELITRVTELNLISEVEHAACTPAPPAVVCTFSPPHSPWGDPCFPHNPGESEIQLLPHSEVAEKRLERLWSVLLKAESNRRDSDSNQIPDWQITTCPTSAIGSRLSGDPPQVAWKGTPILSPILSHHGPKRRLWGTSPELRNQRPNLGRMTTSTDPILPRGPACSQR